AAAAGQAGARPHTRKAFGGFGPRSGRSLLIYLDSSVLLAAVFGESRSPPLTLWDKELTSSRLLGYEVWVRLNAYGLTLSHGDKAEARLDRVDFVELSQSALARALEPFPVPLRTLDAPHL